MSFGISSQLDTQLYISQTMLAWMWTCPTWTWPPCSSIKTTSSLEQWPAGCRYTRPHIFLVKVGLLKLRESTNKSWQSISCMVNQSNFTVLDMVWPYIFTILCFLSWTKQQGNMLWTERWAACGCANEAWWSEWISIVKPRRSCVAAGARLWCRTHGHGRQGHALTGSAFECCSLGIGLKTTCKNLIPQMCFLAASHMPPG